MMGLAFAPPPPAAVSRILSAFSRDQLEGFIAVALDLLDLADGDPDFQQADGDELDFNAAEDDFCDHSGWKCEAGCPVADPDEDDDPGGGNVEDEANPKTASRTRRMESINL
ncbi:MAG TPA: hypothetical protein VNJ04_06990 [Gemmatimonadaceae bacterium]|nr:hypothetical protein [Gemmatimonadaceae bacterium]